ncbi:CZB domain-containing protein [Caldovatus aquaticus]|uniref:CZB domain-containing protein n=1 Tax=Caldovatus aquaticus TaxID=2865671 RepID=A0ABS7EYT2_9PROT|nr:CZB domain-containing protein [Caldovatus aquaticus]MBW8268454.1 CZB domain-containing protein [Caldovatus aquaticus]
MSIEAQIRQAIGAHGLWKARLRTAIETGRSDLDPAVVARDDACDFGRWLHGPTLPEAARRSPHYARVRALHGRFHLCACATLQKALRGDRAGAEADMGPNGPFSAASAELTQAMMAWLGEAGAAPLARSA